ncbi:hypothetical protein M440DRAFT_1389675 [Trichoderma longibrachiatum ATCC 18648]|uniref:Uncharacterized protein n=1 Tax=Trichoderma longibrachiatum ATCC 18648 TaxID=983965 RepID=A0A2T4CDY5_TRILO|nr:hypothetical protein M440DRAFT_1389675 [Trichoderma longibrachiatum ATCC 18648]
MVRPFEPYHDESEPLMKDDAERNDQSGAAAAGNGIVDTTTNTVTEIDHPDAPLETPPAVTTTTTPTAVTTPLEVVDDNGSSSDGSAPTPRFIQDERSSKRWRRIPYPVRRVLLAVAKWSRGPPNPQPYRIRPLFPAVQEYPLRLVDRFLPKAYRTWALFLYFSLWLVTFVLVFFFRQEGRFIKYIKLYALFILCIIISLTLPGLQLRIHHYVLALLLLPGTSLQTRPSLLYQGLLVGLFINGIARWGFDPVLETPAALQGDAQKGTLLPTIPQPVIHLGDGPHSTSNITFTWNQPSSNVYDGISILVNDVERFRGYFDDIIDRQDSFVWSRNATLGLPEYFRFAYMLGSSSGDYTKAGIWSADGEWTKMKPGPSRVKGRDVDEHVVARR